MSDRDRHEWTDTDGCEYRAVADGSLWTKAHGEWICIGSAPNFARQILRLAERERSLEGRLGEVAEALGYDRGILDAPCNVLGHTVRDLAVNLNAALDRERELSLQVAMREATLQMAVTRLGGLVEGQPTHRGNFLQRIDALVEIEENHALQSGSCAWSGSENDGYFTTSCGDAFSLEDGSPKAAGMRWCCYCGKPLPPGPGE